MKRSGCLIVLVLLALLIIVVPTGMAVMPVHAIWEIDTTGDLFWNSRSATIFLTRRRDGWSGNRLQLLWQHARALMMLRMETQQSVKWQANLTGRWSACPARNRDRFGSWTRRMRDT